MNNIIYILYYILNICRIICIALLRFSMLRFFYDIQCYDLLRFSMLRFCYDFQCYDFVTIFHVTILLRFFMFRFCYDFSCYDFVTKVDNIFQKATFFVTKSRRFCYEKSTFSRRFVTISVKHVTKSRRKVDVLRRLLRYFPPVSVVTLKY